MSRQKKTAIAQRISKLPKPQKHRSYNPAAWASLMDASPRFGWIVGSMLMLVSLFPKFVHMLPTDSTVYLYLAGRMLDGARYYTDFFEFNTPFAIGIYTIPVALGQWAGVSAAFAGKIFVSLLIPASIAVVHFIVRHSREWSDRIKYNALIITLFFLLNYNFSFYGNELTTKNSIFLCFILPYIFSLQLIIEKRPLPGGLNALTGILLGLSACLKPHYLLFPVIMETCLAYKMRSLRPAFRWSNLLAGGIAIAYYLGVIPFFFPGYFKEIPLFFELYGPVQRSFVDALLGYRLSNFLQSILYVFPLLLWYVSLRQYLRNLISWWIFVTALVASGLLLNAEALISFDQLAILTFFVALPLLYSLLLFLLHARTSGTIIGNKEWVASSLALIIAFVSVVNIGSILSAFDPAPRPTEITLAKMMAYVQRYAPSSPIYVISEDIGQFPPLLLHSGKRPYPIFHSLQVMFRLQWLRDTYGEALPEGARKADAYFIQSLMRSFTETPPKIVFASNYNYFFESKFERGFHVCFPTMLEMLQANYPQFRTMWEQHYTRIGTIITGMQPWKPDKYKPARFTVSFENKSYLMKLPLKGPIASWLDVYIRKD